MLLWEERPHGPGLKTELWRRAAASPPARQEPTCHLSAGHTTPAQGGPACLPLSFLTAGSPCLSLGLPSQSPHFPEPVRSASPQAPHDHALDSRSPCRPLHPHSTRLKF